jgi:hypothetical protein
MKYSALAGLFALVLGGCMGPDGNPDGQPYATDPGGTVAAPPSVNGVVAYNPESMAPQQADTAPVMGLPPVTPTPQPAAPRR